ALRIVDGVVAHRFAEPVVAPVEEKRVRRRGDSLLGLAAGGELPVQEAVARQTRQRHDGIGARRDRGSRVVLVAQRVVESGRDRREGRTESSSMSGTEVLLTPTISPAALKWTFTSAPKTGTPL